MTELEIKMIYLFIDILKDNSISIEHKSRILKILEQYIEKYKKENGI